MAILVQYTYIFSCLFQIQALSFDLNEDVEDDEEEVEEKPEKTWREQDEVVSLCIIMFLQPYLNTPLCFIMYLYYMHYSLNNKAR